LTAASAAAYDADEDEESGDVSAFMNGRYLREISPSDTTILRLLEERAARAPEGIFFTWGGESVSIGSFNARVNRLARGLRSRGIEAGTHVAVVMATSPDYLALWFALGKLAAVEVSINPAYFGDMLVHQLRTSKCTVVVVDAECGDRVASIAGQLPIRQIIVRGAYETPSDASEWVGFAALDAPTASESDLGTDIAHDAIAGVIFTSGTTGPSKGVLLSHHYLASYGLMYAEVNRLRDDDVLFAFLPFFHMSGKFMTIAALAMNASMRLAPRLSVSTFWEDCRSHGITNFIAVGGICNMLLSRPPTSIDRGTRLRTVYAVPDPADIHKEFEERFGCRMTTVYGSTEVGLPIFRGAADDYVPGSCGTVSPYYEVAIVDAQDEAMPPGEVGEIVVRSKRAGLLGSGYINMPERTVEAWRNLWLHTGDLGRIDADGRCWFEDRASDSMRRRGENISSYEVEQLALKHPAVAEAAAVATASVVGEDEVWLLVTLREGKAVTAAELFEHCRATMPHFMVPRFIEIVDDFPRTATAKVEKYKLRAQGPGPSAWDRDRAGWAIRRGKLVQADPAERRREPARQAGAQR
jgi:carnitine-CoA ligase